MSYEPLHHKYRPQTFAELVGQEAIATTLSNALKAGKIAPAYLFTGPRGTGKTSSARILAKSLNCLATEKPTSQPCGKCEACLAIARGSALDVIEIDAASNTGVDNIREIIERSQFAPVQCRYKVYVIDECHMLSTAAFNALLKTLEEPPQRVIFVLATTDPQRVLPTIISRCQRFDYRRIPLEAMVKHLQKIAVQEKININSESLTLVAQIAQGGLRDAQSLLDQLSLLEGEINTTKVWDLVGATSEQDLMALLEAISAKTPVTILQKCREILNRGREPLILLQNLASFYLNLLIAKTAPQQQDLVTVTPSTWQKLLELAQKWTLADILAGEKQLKESEVQLKHTTQPHLWLELTLLSLIPITTSPTPQISDRPTPSNPAQIPATEVHSDPAKTSTSAVESVYIDGSCLGNPGPGGWAFVIYADQRVIYETGGSEKHTTNQRMELSAAIAALDYLEESESDQEITVYTDSKYVINGITSWIKGWKKNGWRTSSKKPVVNQDLWQRLDLLNSQLRIKWQHVLGHQGNEGNERADSLARSYASEEQPTKTEPPPTVSTPVTPSLDESEVWSHVLSNLQPLTTRALISQQCALISFDGSVARVGIKSEKLLKLHREKLANLEAAFAHTFQRPIRVILQVSASVGLKKNNLTGENYTPPSTPKSLPDSPPRKIISEPEPVKSPSIIETERTEKVDKILSKVPETQLQKAAESLANSFDGEIIDF